MDKTHVHSLTELVWKVKLTQLRTRWAIRLYYYPYPSTTPFVFVDLPLCKVVTRGWRGVERMRSKEKLGWETEKDSVEGIGTRRHASRSPETNCHSIRPPFELRETFPPRSRWSPVRPSSNKPPISGTRNFRLLLPPRSLYSGTDTNRDNCWETVSVVVDPKVRERFSTDRLVISRCYVSGLYTSILHESVCEIGERCGA